PELAERRVAARGAWSGEQPADEEGLDLLLVLGPSGLPEHLRRRAPELVVLQSLAEQPHEVAGEERELGLLPRRIRARGHPRRRVAQDLPRQARVAVGREPPRGA